MNNPPHILMVDDERHISVMTKEYLESNGFEVILKHNAVDGLSAFKSNRFQICVLDVAMPMKDGFTLASEIRDLDPQMPIIFLTGKTETQDRIAGLKLGADDYITKPYSLEELSLRIQNVLKRSRKQSANENAEYRIGQWSFHPELRQLSANGKTITLTTIESKLLQMFCESDSRKVDREAALHKIWKDDQNLHGRSLNVYISKLRKYLQQNGDIDILNVYGEGYRLVVKD